MRCSKGHPMKTSQPVILATPAGAMVVGEGLYCDHDDCVEPDCDCAECQADNVYTVI